MGADDFAAQLATAAKLNQDVGRQQMKNEVLEWAVAHREALQNAGLADSLLKALGQ